MYIKQFGTGAEDLGQGINIDSTSNLYATGFSYGSLPGNNNLGGSDAYIIKYDLSGTQQWIKQFGSSTDDYAYGIKADNSGNVYVTGFTYGALPGFSNLGSRDAYVTKYDANGNRLWIRQFGTTTDEFGTEVTTDTSGNVYVAGYTYGSLSGNSNAGGYDPYIVKYNASGTQQWIRQFGSDSDDTAEGITTDSSNNVYLVGTAANALPGNTHLDADDAYIAKYDANGNRQWLKQFGTNNDDSAYAVATDSSGHIYVTGITQGSLPGNSNAGGYDTFIAKYNSSGTQVWVKQFGTSDYDYGYGIATDKSGNVYVTGYTEGSLPGNSKIGNRDAYVAKYNSSGTQLWIKQFGTTSNDQAYGVSTDAHGNVFVTGQTYDSLPNNNYQGNGDSFVVGFDTNGSLINTITGNTSNNNLAGTTNNDIITGLAGNDTLTGNNGNDTLVGGTGADLLNGGSGKDFFQFNSSSEGIDTIQSFVVADDTILVKASGFAGGLVAGRAITTSQFTIGSAATTSAHRFFYNSSNGQLFFDGDGNGATSAIRIANLSTGLALNNLDIVAF